VFLSHASEDKDRFVIPFAEQLRIRGIEVWVDKWEMLPGESLVGKIFREGLAFASAVIVVLSRVSISKRWLTEELDAAVIKRIKDGSKLIPVVLDGVDPTSEVPASVRHLLFESVDDTAALDDVVDRVVRSVFGDVEKPSLGTPPEFTKAAASRIRGLDRIGPPGDHSVENASADTRSLWEAANAGEVDEVLRITTGTCADPWVKFPAGNGRHNAKGQAETRELDLPDAQEPPFQQIADILGDYMDDWHDRCGRPN
jgi:hypothetical protein